MTMPSTSRSQGTGIDQPLLLRWRVGHQIKATLYQSSGSGQRFFERQRSKLCQPLRAQQPQGLLSRVVREKLEISAPVENGAGCKRIEHVLSSVSCGIK